MAKREHIFLCIPTTDNVMSTGCNWLSIKAMKYNAKKDYPYHFTTATVNDRSPVEFMRNTLTQDFMCTDATRVWMVDNDMMPSGDPFKLLDTPGDIVAGFFLMFKHKSKSNPTTLQVCAFNREDDGRYTPITWKPGDPTVMDVDGVGTGSTIIRRSLFEDDRMLLDDQFTNLAGKVEHLHTDHPNSPKAYFQRHYAPNGQVLLGADLDFCERAKALGYSVKLNMDVSFSQVNKVSLSEMATLIAASKSNGQVEERISDTDIEAVHAAWGNKKYAAPLSFLRTTARYAESCDGAILECGSGATTMIINHICSINPRQEALTLEHEQGWYDKAVANATKDNLHYIAKVNIADGWYDIDEAELPERIGLVVCDGPPAKIGRGALFGRVKDRLVGGYAILMDDAHREKHTLESWHMTAQTLRMAPYAAAKHIARLPVHAQIPLQPLYRCELAYTLRNPHRFSE